MHVVFDECDDTSSESNESSCGAGSDCKTTVECRQGSVDATGTTHDTPLPHDGPHDTLGSGDSTMLTPRAATPRGSPSWSWLWTSRPTSALSWTPPLRGVVVTYQLSTGDQLMPTALLQPATHHNIMACVCAISDLSTSRSLVMMTTFSVENNWSRIFRAICDLKPHSYVVAFERIWHNSELPAPSSSWRTRILFWVSSIRMHYTTCPKSAAPCHQKLNFCSEDIYRVWWQYSFGHTRSLHSPRTKLLTIILLEFAKGVKRSLQTLVLSVLRCFWWLLAFTRGGGSRTRSGRETCKEPQLKAENLTMS